MKQLQLIGTTLGLTMVLLLSGCDEPNLWSWAAGGKNTSCGTDAACFVDAMFLLRDALDKTAGSTERDDLVTQSQTIGNIITDTAKRALVLDMAASIRAGGIIEALKKFSEKASDDFSLSSVGDVCPPGTVSAAETDQLISSERSQYKQIGRVCLAQEAKTDLDRSATLLTELQEAAAADETSSTGDDSLNVASAKDACRDISATNDELCSDVTAQQLQDYVNANL